MSYRSFYHLTGDGAVIKEFILSEADERAAFNLTGVCAFHSGVTVVAFGHEDTHPHTLLHGPVKPAWNTNIYLRAAIYITPCGSERLRFN